MFVIRSIISMFMLFFHLMQCGTVKIYEYISKYLFRRIPYASHADPTGSFKNPFVISNKETCWYGLKGNKAHKACTYALVSSSCNNQQSYVIIAFKTRTQHEHVFVERTVF